ncbi:uL11 family ribosomal protein [Candidatus Vidania fulgoroideorum]
MKIIKLELEANKASPNSILNSCLGPHGINVKNFCRYFNEKTKDKIGYIIPCLLFLKEKGKYKIKLKTPTVSFLVKKINKNIVNYSDIKKIYNIKKKSFNTNEKKKIIKSIIGTLKSMKVKYVI